jgi:hypothetical protein
MGRDLESCPQSANAFFIGEKLFSFVAVSEHRSEFAAELPHFVDEIRRIFTAQQIGCYLDELECSFFAPCEPEDDSDLDECGVLDNPILGAEEILRFAGDASGWGVMDMQNPGHCTGSRSK